MRSPYPLAVLTAVLMLAACNGSDRFTAIIGGEEGRLDLAITDAPVDGVSKVSVRFIGVELQPTTGDRVRIDFDAAQLIDLYALRGGFTRLLLHDHPVPAGGYQWLRLLVQADRDSLDSFVETSSGALLPLHIAGGELHFDGGFELPRNELSELIVDVDLRRALLRPALEHYLLRPALRLIDARDAGSLGGEIASSYLSDVRCGDPGGNAVYVYSGFGIIPDDIDGGPADPVTTAEVIFDHPTNAWRYEVPFLTAGAYTVAFTCQADLDDPDRDDPTLLFSRTAESTVSAGFHSELNFL